MAWSSGTNRHFHLGAAVHGVDGRVGVLKALVVDAASLTVTHLVLHRDVLRRTAVTVPLMGVVVPAGDRVVIGMPVAEVKTADRVPEGAAFLSRSCVVECEM